MVWRMLRTFSRTGAATSGVAVQMVIPRWIWQGRFGMQRTMAG